MKIKFFCPYWGSEHMDYENFLIQAKKSGYDGIEIILPYDNHEKRNIKEVAESLGLEIIAQLGGVIYGDFETSLEIYESHLRNACSIGPLFVNAQSGKDFFSFEENLAFITLAKEIENETGVKVIHETHRGKFSYSPLATKKYLDRLPDLRITADFSHWCCVSESLLDEQEYLLESAIERSSHIHARVGFDQGPQIIDPRLPEWNDELTMHLNWWDRIIDLSRSSGNREYFTITPEFGPIPYMHTIPYTNQPIASQWEINLAMRNILNERYNIRI